MAAREKLNSFFSLLCGLLLSIFVKSPPRPTAADLQQAEFKTSTQQLGIRFTEKIRDVFRFKWLKKQRINTDKPNIK
jgi:hypothetical protein